MLARISYFSEIVARLQWDAEAIDLGPDAATWSDLDDARRARLTSLLSGFCVAEEAVSEHLVPFGDVAEDSLVTWVFFLQRRDEQRHALLFDRIAREVLGLPGDDADARREAAREHAPAAILELFEERLPATSAALAEGTKGLADGVALYHMLLEGVVFGTGQRTLLDELDEVDLPGIREGVGRVERDERWHVGFGLRCLAEADPPQELIDELAASAEDVAAAWGDLAPEETRQRVAHQFRRRLGAAGLRASAATVEA